MIPKGWYLQEEEMDDECFNTSQASDLDRIIISPDVLWEPSSVLPSGLRTSQTKPRPLEDDSSAMWRASLGQANQQAVVGCWGFANMSAKPNAPMKGRSPTESGEVSQGGSLDLPVDEGGKSCLRGVIMPQGSAGSGHNMNRNAGWSRLSDSGVCKSCDDIRMTSVQRLASGPDWYRYPNMVGRCMSQDQGFSRARKSPTDSCNRMGMSSPRAYPRTPTPGRSNIQKRVDQQGPQKPLYLRMKQSQQFYPQHLHTHQSTDAQNYNVYGEHNIYTPIYTTISDNVVSHSMQYPQMKFARASSNQNAQIFPPQWKDSNSGNQGKVFTCQHQGCGKSFKRAEHLNRHRRMHTGERPFACNEPGCDRRFSRTDNLAAHRKIHRKGRSEFGPSNAQVIDPSFKVSSDKEGGGNMAQPLECVVNASDNDTNTHMNRNGSIGNFSGDDPNRINPNLGTSLVPKSECSASDAETEGSSATERSGAREMSPVTLHCSGVQNAYQLPLLHEGDSMIMPGHGKGVPRYQDSIQQSQHSIHPPLF